MKKTLTTLLKVIESDTGAFVGKDYCVGMIRKGIENHEFHYITMRGSYPFLTDASLYALHELYNSLKDCPENMIDAEIDEYLQDEEYELRWKETIHYHIGYSLDKYILNFRDCVE